MGYRVIIAIKNDWWSDQKRFASLKDARAHRKSVAERWSDCDTAIAAPDGRVLLFKESILEQRKLAEMAA